ncbi:CapA family protein [Pedobacter sp. MC2016-14]|uniref:CapA family protein n=1 Tax=Pedobacter sp. MC2016-14 TaxID=2897327 RepID=UPI001E3F7C7B|nr:CapA family protein [Pedobacter sp. MC2016-14]MCD0487078.1 CapA family protein [Pedobacter sp. MC2016-14]
MKLYSLGILGFITLIILLRCAGSTANVSSAEVPFPQAKDSLTNDTLSITAVGDIMIGSAYPSKSNLPKDAAGSFKNVASYLTGDIVFGNLEGCFLNQGKSTKCKDTLGNSCFAFRMPEHYAGIYKAAGFNVLSVANNHVGDFGLKGRKRSTEILDSLNINYAGLVSHPYILFTIDSVRYGFCAFAPNENTVSINNLDSATKIVSFLKQQADIVIVSFHGGAEGAKYEHVTRKKEIFYQENRGNVYAFAHAVIDAGADVVLGHGPHVTRAVEVYKKKFITYSMGNFCTYGMFSLKGANGFAPLLQLKINTKGDFISAEVISVKQDKINHLTLDPGFTAFKKITDLTNADFPNHGLTFTENRFIKIQEN